MIDLQWKKWKDAAIIAMDENERLKAINAELLAACERVLPFIDVAYHRGLFEAAIANAQQGE